jgi:hypothetical protein
MSIEKLPKDLLGLIFKNLWRKDAKALPTTCKLFLLILTSKRWFKGWQKMDIIIQELPNGMHEALQQAAIKANKHNPNIPLIIIPLPRRITLQYDHLDTVSNVLLKFKNLIVTTSADTEYHSFYGLDEKDNTATFNSDNFLVNELAKLPAHQQSTIYCSDFSFQELQQNRRTYFETWDTLLSSECE